MFRADPDTDEIHYFRIDILDMDLAGGSVGLFLESIELLGTECICQDDYGTEELAEDFTEFEQALIEDMNENYTSSIFLDKACIDLFANENGLPSCEILCLDLSD